jgi:phenylacetate-CoA ligase
MMLRSVCRSLLTLSRVARPNTRAASNSFRHAMSERRRLSQLDAVEVAAYQITALQHAVRKAADIPFWRNRFHECGFNWKSNFGYSEFASIPPLERTEIAEAGDGMLAAGIAPAVRRKMATGGSSGTPTVTWTGPVERGWGESAAAFYEEAVGLKPGDRVALLWGHNLDPVTRATPKERLEDWMLNRRWFDCFRLSTDVLLSYHRELEEYRPKVIQAYASALYSLAEVIRDHSLPKPTYPSLGFVTGAEKVYDWQREVIENVFGKPVFERYGGRDIGMIGVQLHPWQTTAFDVDWHNVHVETEGGAAESELLVTKLHADAMPLIRYRSGDIVRVAQSSSPGTPLMRLLEVTGRTLHRVLLPDGSWMHGTVVPHLLKDFPLHKYQLRQAEDLSAELLVIPSNGYDANQEATIRLALEQNLPGIELRIRRVSDIPTTSAGKWLPVVSMVRKPFAQETR